MICSHKCYRERWAGNAQNDIQSMILSQKVITLKRYVEEHRSPWKNILDQNYEEAGWRFPLYCNFDINHKLSINLPVLVFHKEYPRVWYD